LIELQINADIVDSSYNIALERSLFDTKIEILKLVN
jgi:hypothetical protein